MKKATILLATLFSAQLMAMDTPNLSCFGTEPFWDLRTSQSILSWNIFDDNPTHYKITSVAPAHGTGEGWTTLITAEKNGQKVSLITRKEECNDGMSDNIYKYSAYVQTENGLFVGCCNEN